MKQFLRSFLTLLLLMMWCSVGFAQTTIWSEDWTGQEGKEPNKVSPMYSVTNSSIRSSDDYAGGSAPELMIKTGGTWSVTISDLKGCNNSFTLLFKTNRHTTSKYISVTANGKTISCPQEGKTSTHSGTFELNVATGKNLVLTFKANGDNCRIDDIKLTGTPVESKPTLTFSETEKTVYKGSESSFTMPTLVLKDKDGKEVTSGVDYLYEVTDANPEGCLDVDMITGKITFNELGTANIKVTTSTTDSGSEFNNLTASYILNYKKVETTLTLSKTSVSVNLGETPELPTCTLKAGDEIITNKTLSYTITPEGIANIDPTTGELTLISVGKAKINVSFTGDETYEASNIASYDLTVVDPNALEVTFDFSDCRKYGYDKPTSNSKRTELKVGDVIKSSPITITVIGEGSTKNGFGTTYLGVYQSGALKIEIEKGYVLNEVSFERKGDNNTLKINDNKAGEAWTGKASSVTLSVPAGAKGTQVTSITIKYSKTTVSTTLTLDENADDTNTKIEANKGKTQDVALTRTLVAKKWNTFCVPFETEITGTALDGAIVKAIGTIEGNVINLVDAAKIEAGVPYLVMPTTGDIVNPTFKGVTISVTTPVEKGNDEYKFVGTYSPKTITDQEFGTIWGVTAEGKLAKINADTTMKGLRAYFVFQTNTAAAKLNFDGETTGINNIETNATVNGKVYNLNGQYVGNSLNGLKKGIYVVNGKKVIK